VSTYLTHNNLNRIIDPGALDIVVTPLIAATARTESGHTTTTYTGGTTFRAARYTSTPSEVLETNFQNTQQRTTIIARYGHAYKLNIADRLQIESKNYDIIGFEPLGRRRYIKIHLNPLNN
jgi:CTP synthase (UTP-ammonia lyase)